MRFKRTIDAELVNWKESSLRMPLLIRGARQVGKSFSVEHFGKTHFDNCVVVNFDFQPQLAACFNTLDPKQILSQLELLTGNLITPSKTLLFLDEIQACPKAILALRYFKEKMPDLHVIGAGSWLDFTLNDAAFSFPVGRVQFMYLRPLSFLEFLWALKKEKWVEKLKNSTQITGIEESLHLQLLALLKQYFLVGGMPAAVYAFMQTSSYLECQRMQALLLQTYKSDFGKYAFRVQHKYIQLLFEAAPYLVGEHFKYAKVEAEARARDFRPALEYLQKAGLVQVVKATKAALPLGALVQENRQKLIFLDVGLMQNAIKIDPKAFLEEEVLKINSGKVAEQYVAQELLCAFDPYEEPQLYYWERDKKGSQAEVDYVLTVDEQVIPVEVKAGKTGRLKSLHQFITDHKSPLGVHISANWLGLENNILSVPLYMVHEIPRLVRNILRKNP